MMIDASAIIAILNAEADAARLAEAIDAAKAPFTSPNAVYELAVALVRENEWTAEEAGRVVRKFLDTASMKVVKVVMISETIATGAAQAFEKFGDGRHPANLNLGDCFSSPQESRHADRAAQGSRVAQSSRSVRAWSVAPMAARKNNPLARVPGRSTAPELSAARSRPGATRHDRR